MKLAILGGGGFRVPIVYRALLAETSALRAAEVMLQDPSAVRLAAIESVLAAQAQGHSDAPPVSSTTSLEAALDGADFVFSAIRVGGLQGRVQDERMALSLGVLGQETTGPGGIAYGMRTVPVAVRIAERAAQLCPGAYVVNFTNPAGMITEAMQGVLGDRVIGICDTPEGLGRRIVAAADVPPGQIRLDYVGLNHLGWMRGVSVGGRDVLPGLLSNDQALAALDEAAIFGVPWLRALNCVPNEYLYYYYFSRDAIRSILNQQATRGEFLQRQQDGFYAAAAASPRHALQRWQDADAERRALYMAEARKSQVGPDQPPSGGRDAGGRDAGGEPPAETGYAGVALSVMRAIVTGQRARLILNVRNGTALGGFDASAVVELPSTVDAAGAHPLPTAAPDLHQLGLMQQLKAVERLAIEAALTGSPDAALKAFALHPLVDSVSVARDLLRGYQAAWPQP